MTNLKQTEPTMNYNGIWSKDDKNRLAKMLTLMHKNQKTYSEELDLRARIAGLSMFFEKEFPMDSLLMALRSYMRKTDVMPTPSCIDKILNPVNDRKISQSQYIEALKQRDLDRQNGCSNQFTWANTFIADYHTQESRDELQEKEVLQIPDQMQGLLSGAIKRIED